MHKKRILVFALLLCLVLSGCGGKDPVPGTVTPSTTVPAETEKPASLGRLEGGVVLPDLREHPLAGVDDGVGEHAGHSTSGYLPPAVVDPPEFAVPCH